MSEINRLQTGDSLALENRFAHRAGGMVASEIRALFAVASRPEIVSLAGGMPNLSALPMEMIDRKSTRLNSSHSQQSRMPSSA